MSYDIAVPASATGEGLAIARLIEILAGVFPDVPAEVVADEVHRVHAAFAEAPVREFIPVLVERTARTDLAAISDSRRP